MLSSGSNVIIWDEMLSSGLKDKDKDKDVYFFLSIIHVYSGEIHAKTRLMAPTLDIIET
jgi:hypothetical protein